MSRESYARGFVKAAAAAGVDPTELAKFAQVKKITPGVKDIPKEVLIGNPIGKTERTVDDFGIPNKIKEPLNNVRTAISPFIPGFRHLHALNEASKRLGVFSKARRLFGKSSPKE